MSTGPIGIIAGAAGSPLAQIKGHETERAAQDRSVQQRHSASELKADEAAGVGATSEDQPAEDRDADGRRLWEEDAPPRDEASQATGSAAEHRPPDPTGQRGSHLDLSG